MAPMAAKRVWHGNPALKRLLVRVDSLLVDPENLRVHDDRSIEAIVASLRTYGQQKPAVVHPVEAGRIIAGNGLLAAARALEWTHLAVVTYHGDDPKGFALADNRTAELSGWDGDLLAEHLRAMDEVDPAWWTADELAGVLSVEAEPVALPDDVAPEPPAEPITQLGDLWLLGNHRLLCGDATVAADVAKVTQESIPLIMVADPAYGVGYDPAWRESLEAGARRLGQFSDDEEDWGPAWALFRGPIAYVWCAPWTRPWVHAEAITRAGLELRAHIIWLKQHFVMSRGHYHPKHESCFYAVRQGAHTARWATDRKQTTVWEIQNANAMGGQTDDMNTNHSAQKPVECMARPIRNHGAEGDTVYDPFVGTGTTIVAAEQLGRRCVAIEIDPGWCDVTVQRWEALTGGKATRRKARSHAKAT